MTDEEILFKLYNEAYGGYYNMIVRALKDEEINADNLARYIYLTIKMYNIIKNISEALDGNSDRCRTAYKKIASLQSELRSRMREKYK